MSSVIALLGAFQLATAPMADARISLNFPASASITPSPAPQLSDWYYRRLTIHRHANYAMLPLFVAQYRHAHRNVAIASMATATSGYALMLDLSRRDEP